MFRDAHQSPPGPGERAAFTLAELVVVMAIVALLAGLVVSAGWYARQRARVFECTAHLQQLGVVVALYLNDYDSKLPVVWPMQWWVVQQPAPPAPPWYQDVQFTMGDYVSDPAVFSCPVAAARAQFPGHAKYDFNPFLSGMRVPPLPKWAGPARAVVIYDQLSAPGYAAHLYHYNALFLDGHVTSYRWIEALPPSWNQPWPPN